ncbi:LEA type 2 family protein [Halorubrum cibi]|uniref:LEA14-like dessication related protein n=1 Tax=Halorubrum cibi TaxID=413815 RepID=A0A521BZ58_9EURY|nr:LEA type 2 family protein [Halorubrum cibi]SMO52466.1 LEA14-like dessication related protein [Halorubrum cibi]
MDTGAVRSVLVGSKVRIALLGLLVVVGSVGGAFALGVLGTPSVAAVDNTFGEVTNETTTVETDIVVANPNPIGVGLDGVAVNYTVSMNDVEMARGGREGIRIGTGNSTLGFETRMRNDAIPPWWTSHVRNDEQTDVVIDATVTSDRLGRGVEFSRTREIETDLLGAFNSGETRPVNADSALVDDPVLYVNETRGQWGSVSETETPIDMAFVVYNPNLEPYAVTEIGYDVTMNGVEMASGRTDEGYVIPSRASETVEFTTALDNRRLDEWWVTHLDEEVNGHQVSDLRIEFYAVIEFPSGEEVTVPLDQLTYEETIETDIFGEGEDVRDSSGSDGGTEADRDDSDSTDGSSDGDTDGGTDDTTDGGTDDTTDGGTDDTTDGGTDDTTDGGTDDTTDGGTDDTTDGTTDDGVLPL